MLLLLPVLVKIPRASTLYKHLTAQFYYISSKESQRWPYNLGVTLVTEIGALQIRMYALT